MLTVYGFINPTDIILKNSNKCTIKVIFYIRLQFSHLHKSFFNVNKYTAECAM